MFISLLIIHLYSDDYQDLESAVQFTFTDPTDSAGLAAVSSSPLHAKLHEEICSILNIPASLSLRPKVADLHLSYSKYLALLATKVQMYRMMADGTWTLKSLTTDELIEVFISKSVWHANYSKLFPKVPEYPQIVKWLKGDSDAPSNIDVFGLDKQLYTFKDLRNVLDIQIDFFR